MKKRKYPLPAGKTVEVQPFAIVVLKSDKPDRL